MKYLQFWKLRFNCIHKTAYKLLAKILSEPCCFCKQFSQAFGKKHGRTSHKPLENNEKYRRLYSGIHLLAMPEKNVVLSNFSKQQLVLEKAQPICKLVGPSLDHGSPTRKLCKIARRIVWVPTTTYKNVFKKAQELNMILFGWSQVSSCTDPRTCSTHMITCRRQVWVSSKVPAGISGFTNAE